MKLLHTGDLHLGKSLGDFDLIEDQRYILDRILDIVQEEEVDAVLIAGDVYDRAIPSEAAVRLLDSFLCRLAEAGADVYMISGNHDSDDRLNFGSGLFEASRIHISSVFDGSLYKRIKNDENGEVAFYLLPFVKASQVRHFFPEDPIETYEDAVRTILANASIDKSKRSVLIAHQYVAGQGGDPRLAGSEGPAVSAVGTVERIGCGCFDGFDYVALGHIHSPQKVGREEVRYSGSPLKYSFSEVNDNKSVPVITLGAKGDVNIELVPLIPKRDLRHLKGPMEKLLDAENVQAPEDFIYATLTDEDPQNDVMGIFRQFYPNTVKIDFDNSHTREIEQVDLSQIGETRSFTELVSGFYQQIYGCEISEEEMNVLKQAAKEAGIIDEAG